MKWIVGLLVLCVLILLHELGHFIAAKKAGVFVEEFAIGMGPRIFSKVSKKSGTRYSLRLVPVGGFCAMKGEAHKLDDDGKEIVISDADAFSNATVWKRMGIVSAGVLVNLLLGLLLSFVCVMAFGHDTPLVTDVTPTAQSAGLQEGDEVIRINDTSIGSSHELYFYQWYTMNDHPETMDVTVLRDGQELDITYPTNKVLKYGFGISTGVNDDGELVIMQFLDESALSGKGPEPGDCIVQIRDVRASSDYTLSDYLDDEPLSDEAVSIVYRHEDTEKEITIEPVSVESEEFGFGYSSDRSDSDNLLKDTWSTFRYQVVSTGKSLSGLVTGKFGIRDLAGPVSIMDTIGSSSSAIAEASTADAKVTAGAEFLMLIIMLTVNLGILNLLPIPGLDGGHLVFLIIEAVRKKPVSVKIQMGLQAAGMLCLLTLMSVVLIKDFYQMLF